MVYWSWNEKMSTFQAVSAHLLSLIVESRKQVEKFSQLVKMTNSGGGQLNTTLSQVIELDVFP